MLLSVCFRIHWISIEVHSLGSQHMRHPSVDVCGSQAVERAAWSPGDTDLLAKTAQRLLSPSLHSHLKQWVRARWELMALRLSSLVSCPQSLSQVALHIFLLIFITLNPVRKAYVLHQGAAANGSLMQQRVAPLHLLTVDHTIVAASHKHVPLLGRADRGGAFGNVRKMGQSGDMV